MTLKRTLEPEVMDSAEDAMQYNDMDHSQVNQNFVDDLMVLLQSDANFQSRLIDDQAELLDVLDVGTGTALIPALLCDQQSAFRVMAIDMAVNMLDLATYNVEACSRPDRIQLAKVDAKDLDYDTEMFDVVISNSIVHHIPNPEKCLAEMVRVLKRGGAMFVRDLMRPDDEATLESIVQTYAGDESEYSRRLFRESLHASLSLDEIRQIVIELGWDPQGVQATSDRHWTWSAIEVTDV
jgi:ubiquinone/menaquinone biosynthesis C-methylase UbiE